MDATQEKGLELALKGGNYSPVSVTNHDTVGAAFLGVIAVVLLGAFLFAQRRIWKMEKQRVETRIVETK